MEVKYTKSIRIETNCHDKASFANKKSKGHNLVAESIQGVSRYISPTMKILAPNGVEIYVEAEALKIMCEKIIALDKI